MKERITEKHLRGLASNCRKVIELGYCEGQFLLHAFDPWFYCSGIYGWNFDVYMIDDVMICTGYRRMLGKRPSVSIKEFEEEAERICATEEDYRKSVERRKNLLRDFIGMA